MTAQPKGGQVRDRLVLKPIGIVSLFLAPAGRSEAQLLAADE